MTPSMSDLRTFGFPKECRGLLSPQSAGAYQLPLYRWETGSTRPFLLAVE